MHQSVLHSILQSQSEHENLEFKEAKQSFNFEKLLNYCVALANEKGGKLILGVSDKHPRHVVGTSAFPNVQKLKQDIFAAIKLKVEIEEYVENDKRVVVLNVPSRPTGTALNYKGTYWMRVGEELQPMDFLTLSNIVKETQSLDFETEFATDPLSVSEVLLRLDYDHYFRLTEQPIPSNHETILAALESENIINSLGDQFRITNLGAILFARNLKDFLSLSRKQLRIIKYVDNSKVNAASETSVEQGYASGFDTVLKTINSLIPTQEKIEGAYRVQNFQYPEIAIREIVANALIHQDFTQRGTGVMVEIFPNRFEVTNPGSSLVQADRFIDSAPKSRNERIASLMRRMRLCEERGSGIDKVILSIEKEKLPAPNFQVFDDYTKVTLFAHKELNDMSRTDKIRACYQHCCLKYVSGEFMSNADLRERFGIEEKNYSKASRIISETVNENLIKPFDQTASRKELRYIPHWA